MCAQYPFDLSHAKPKRVRVFFIPMTATGRVTSINKRSVITPTRDFFFLIVSCGGVTGSAGGLCFGSEGFAIFISSSGGGTIRESEGGDAIKGEPESGVGVGGSCVWLGVAESGSVCVGCPAGDALKGELVDIGSGGGGATDAGADPCEPALLLVSACAVSKMSAIP
jgi:hypothetical protein